MIQVMDITAVDTTVRGGTVSFEAVNRTIANL